MSKAGRERDVVVSQAYILPLLLWKEKLSGDTKRH